MSRWLTLFRPRRVLGWVPSRQVPVLVLASSLLLSSLATYSVAESARERDQVRFLNAVSVTRDRVEGRMETYEAVLRGVAGLFAADSAVSRSEFQEYVERLNIGSRYPGLQGVGWTQYLRPGDSTRVQERQQWQGFEDFHFWPDTAEVEAHAILYLEPLDARNRAALGFNMFSEPRRREAMIRARDLGEPALSARVVLVQEITQEVQPGFLLYVPVYRGGLPPSSQEDRRERLEGFAYSPFRAGDLFHGIFQNQRRPEVSFRIYDGAQRDSANLLYDSRSLTEKQDDDREFRAGERERFTETVRLQVAGRTWTMHFTPTAAFQAESRTTFVLPVALVGLLISLILFGLSWLQSRAQEAAKRAQAEAEEANQAKSQFLATMSHELRTPLNAIGGYVDLIQLGIRGPTTEEQQHDLARIKRAQDHLLGLINDVLNFAKLEAGRVELDIQDVPVTELFAAVEPIVVPLAQARGVRYSTEEVEGAPQIRADRDKVRQILLNLLSNAVKFTEAGGEVVMGCRRGESAPGERREWTDVWVRDTGVGIPQDKLDDIFDPFVQVNADLTRTTQGSGLGLAISEELARAMGGALWAESEEGRGSTFTLRLPVPKEEDEEGEREQNGEASAVVSEEETGKEVQGGRRRAGGDRRKPKERLEQGERRRRSRLE